MLQTKSALLDNIDESKYRPEIDGLRALAVLAVITNHFNKDFLPGGYLGVDIFFVISGYVITASLSSKKKEKSFIKFIYNFYSRRLKRLVPALCLFVIVIGILICFFNPAADRILLAGVYSLLGISNIYFFNNAIDYFSQSTLLNPFTHTWSLGVEEQFYLFYPIIFWFSGYGKKKQNGERPLIYLLIFLSLISLILFIYFYKFNQPAAYFLTPNRFWEIAAGCLVFFGYKNNFIQYFLNKIPCYLFIILILSIFFIPLSLSIISTILIVLSTGFLLINFKNNALTYKLFSHPKIVFIGLMSYSLYLWHWGVLALSRWTVGINKWTIIFQLVIIFLLGFASYQFIESPIRRKNLKKAKIFFSSISIILVGIFSLIIFRENKKFLYLGKTRDFGEVARINGDIKFTLEKPKRNFLVLGDSYVGHYKYLFMKLSKEHLVNVSLYKRGYENFKKVIIDNESILKDNDVVVISIGNDKDIFSKKSLKIFEDLVQFINRKNYKLILIGRTPFFREGVYALCSKEWFRPNVSEDCSSNIRSKIYNEIRPLKLFYEKLSMNKNVYFFDPFNYLCPEDMFFCQPVQDGKYLFSDASHLNKNGSLKIYPEIVKYMIIRNLLPENFIKE